MLEKLAIGGRLKEGSYEIQGDKVLIELSSQVYNHLMSHKWAEESLDDVIIRLAAGGTVSA